MSIVVFGRTSWRVLFVAPCLPCPAHHLRYCFCACDPPCQRAPKPGQGQAIVAYCKEKLHPNLDKAMSDAGVLFVGGARKGVAVPGDVWSPCFNSSVVVPIVRHGRHNAWSIMCFRRSRTWFPHCCWVVCCTQFARVLLLLDIFVLC